MCDRRSRSGGIRSCTILRRKFTPRCFRIWIRLSKFWTSIAKAIVDRAIRKAEEEIPGVKGSYIITGDRPYVEKDDDSELLANLKAAVKETTGEEAVVGSFNGYTDTAVIAGTLMNHNCMSYGPGSLELAHKPNEYVPYEDVCRVEKVLSVLAENVLFS